MKKLLKSSVILMTATLIFFGCKKSASSGTTPLTGTTWSIAGNTYKGTFTGFTNNELLSTDNNVNGIPNIGIQFSSMPSAGSYSVVNPLSVVVGQGQCSIQTSNSSGGAVLVSYNGGSVTVSVTNGKITATFNNVPMGAQTGFDSNNNPTFASAGTISGKLTEQ